MDFSNVNSINTLSEKNDLLQQAGIHSLNIPTTSTPINISTNMPAVNNPYYNSATITKFPENPANRVLPGSLNTSSPANINNYQKMYDELSLFVSKDVKKQLKAIHENRKLASTKSNDGSSTIENLYRIMKEPRAAGLDSKIIINETVKTLADPYIITQNFGKVPEVFLPELISDENTRVDKKTLEKLSKQKTNRIEYEKVEMLKKVDRKDIDFSKGHTCPGASIEFDLADKKPAEFARYIEKLTSPEKSVKTKIKYSNIADDMPGAISRLVEWKVDYKKLSPETIEATLRPDENAYSRAIIQEYARAKNSRSVVDALLQSTFMQTGSAKTYNSLTDLRSEDTGQGRGLNQEEGAFVESIVDYEGGKESVTFMNLDDNLTKILNYNYDAKTTEKMLTDTIKSGKNIMVGFLTDVEQNGNLASDNGHEILLTGIMQDKKGIKHFIYNDTDDGEHFAPSYIKADELIRTLHHANLPKEIVRQYSLPAKDYRAALFTDYWEIKSMNKSPIVSAHSLI